MNTEQQSRNKKNLTAETQRSRRKKNTRQNSLRTPRLCGETSYGNPSQLGKEFRPGGADLCSSVFVGGFNFVQSTQATILSSRQRVFGLGVQKFKETIS